MFHFISYVPFKGKVYELDGLQEGPIYIGDYENDWLSVAKEAITKRINLYQEKETAFTLLAINECRKYRVDLLNYILGYWNYKISRKRNIFSIEDFRVCWCRFECRIIVVKIIITLKTSWISLNCINVRIWRKNYSKKHRKNYMKEFRLQNWNKKKLKLH